jgi:hypothetical protein
MEAKLQESPVSAAERIAPSFTLVTARGEWPSAVSDLPLVLTQHQLAHLRGITVRTLQRERRLGCSIPFIRDGKRVLYARADVLAHYGAARAA